MLTSKLPVQFKIGVICKSPSNNDGTKVTVILCSNLDRQFHGLQKIWAEQFNCNKIYGDVILNSENLLVLVLDLTVRKYNP